jgi:hypothetical protein
MPFKSSAQRAYMFIHLPKLAKEFAAHTPKGAKLPKHVEGAFKRAKRKKKK